MVGPCTQARCKLMVWWDFLALGKTGHPSSVICALSLKIGDGHKIQMQLWSVTNSKHWARHWAKIGWHGTHSACDFEHQGKEDK